MTRIHWQMPGVPRMHNPHATATANNALEASPIFGTHNKSRLSESHTNIHPKKGAGTKHNDSIFDLSLTRIHW